MVKGKFGAPKMKSRHSRGASSCQCNVVGKESSFKEAYVKFVIKCSKQMKMFISVRNARKKLKIFVSREFYVKF